MSQYKPLTLELIEEGDYLKAVNNALLELQRQMIVVKREYGAEACKGMVGSLSAKIKIKLEDMGERTFSISGEITKSVPIRPKMTTVGLEDDQDSGVPALFVRSTGSSQDDPRQGVLFPSPNAPAAAVPPPAAPIPLPPIA
jgi:hypothetical protein